METSTVEDKKSKKGEKGEKDVLRPSRLVATVRLGQIEADDSLNCRTEYKDIDDLAASIHKEGLISPLTVVKRPGSGDNGEAVYELLSGFRRRRAMKLLKWPKDREIPVVIREMPEGEEAPGDLAIANLVENTARAEVHPSDLARTLARLEDEFGKSRKEIAEKTSLSGSYIGNLIRAFKQLTPDVAKAWRKENLPTNFVNVLAKLEPAEQEQRLEEYKAQKEAVEEAGGRKNKKRAKDEGGRGGEESDEADADTGAVWRSRADVKDQMEELRGKIADASAADAAILKAELKALRWVAGEITRL